MKKLAAFILLIVYTCVSSGVAISAHYCMNKLRSVELGASKKDVCANCGMHKNESHGCCRDEVKVVKLQQDTHLATLLMPSFDMQVPALPLSQHLFSPFYNFLQSGAATVFQPPPLPADDTYLRNRVFRI